MELRESQIPNTIEHNTHIHNSNNDLAESLQNGDNEEAILFLENST